MGTWLAIISSARIPSGSNGSRARRFFTCGDERRGLLSERMIDFSRLDRLSCPSERRATFSICHRDRVPEYPSNDAMLVISETARGKLPERSSK
jgi:hypothetical protein